MPSFDSIAQCADQATPTTIWCYGDGVAGCKYMAQGARYCHYCLHWLARCAINMNLIIKWKRAAARLQCGRGMPICISAPRRWPSGFFTLQSALTVVRWPLAKPAIAYTHIYVFANDLKRAHCRHIGGSELNTIHFELSSLSVSCCSSQSSYVRRSIWRHKRTNERTNKVE